MRYVKKQNHLLCHYHKIDSLIAPKMSFLSLISSNVKYNYANYTSSKITILIFGNL